MRCLSNRLAELLVIENLYSPYYLKAILQIDLGILLMQATFWATV